MDYVEAGLLILLVAAGSVIAADLVRRALDVDLRRRQHEVGNPLYMQIGVVFAVLLAFVFNEVFGEYNAAAQAINGECGALHGAAMLANDLSDGQGKVVEQAILDYSRIVVSAEWEALSHRQPSVDAQNAFHKIVLAAGRLNPTRSTDSAIQSQLLSLISQAHAFRETRLFHANQGLPITIWVVLLFYSLLLVAFVLFAGVESRVVHLFFTAAFSTSVILVLIVVRMLDYPFEGARRWTLGSVRFGSKADICAAKTHVRFAPNSDGKSGFSQTAMSALPPESGHVQCIHLCLLWARSRHVERTARVRQGPEAEVISRSVGLANWPLAITLPGF